MQHRTCDMPDCGRKIETHELAKQPAQVKTALGLVTVSFSLSFAGARPDICNSCLLDAAATLDPRKSTDNKVVQLPVRGGGENVVR